MDGHTIRAVVLELPTSPLGEVATDSEIWETDDGEAHIKMTRHELPIENSGMDFFVLSISGPTIERQRVAQDFCTYLGEPEETTQSSESDGIDFIGWLVRRDAVR